MKKSLLYLFATLFFGLSLFGQASTFERPDLDAIEKAVKDKEGPYYFVTLMERYKVNDSTLTIKDYKHLYYGFEYQDSYTTPKSIVDNAALKKAREKKDWGTFAQLQKTVIEAAPFDLREIYFLSQALESIGMLSDAAAYKKSLLKLVDAIKSTGDGLTPESGYYITKVAHEYDMMAFLGFDRGGGQALVKSKYGSVDKLLVAKNDQNISALYFNATIIFQKYEKIF